MKILVVNGSPRGEMSITLQTMLYLQKKYPSQDFDFLTAGGRIRTYEKDFSEASAKLLWADLILFSYPVYTFLLPSQLTRFLELIFENAVDLSGKWVSQFSTSKHFYDVTAHRFLEENVRDLGMKYVRGLSADMEDLPTEKGQKEACDFFDFLLWSVENDIYETGRYGAKEPNAGESKKKEDQMTGQMAIPEGPAKEEAKACGEAASEGRKKPGKRAVIVTDMGEDEIKLAAMVDHFQRVFPYETDLLNLRHIGMKGGCLGCLNCTASGKCIYTDGFSDLLRNKIQTADAVVYAFSVKYHGMGSLFKTYDDRQFCNGHRTVTMGSPVAYLVHGRLSEEVNLRMVIEARAETGGNYLAGIATDEADTEAEILRMSRKLAYALDHSYAPPQNFYGVGGIRIFRDLIYLMRGMMKADHKFFKEKGMYDFPQKKKGTMAAMYLVGAMFSNEKLKKKLGDKINEGMLAPYKKVLAAADEKKEGQD